MEIKSLFNKTQQCVQNESFCLNLESSLSQVKGGIDLHLYLTGIADSNTELLARGVFLKPTRKDSGTILSYCPFCGTNIEKFHKILKP